MTTLGDKLPTFGNWVKERPKAFTEFMRGTMNKTSAAQAWMQQRNPDMAEPQPHLIQLNNPDVFSPKAPTRPVPCVDVQTVGHRTYVCIFYTKNGSMLCAPCEVSGTEDTPSLLTILEELVRTVKLDLNPTWCEMCGAREALNEVCKCPKQ